MERPAFTYEYSTTKRFCILRIHMHTGSLLYLSTCLNNRLIRRESFSILFFHKSQHVWIKMIFKRDASFSKFTGNAHYFHSLCDMRPFLPSNISQIFFAERHAILLLRHLFFEKAPLRFPIPYSLIFSILFALQMVHTTEPIMTIAVTSPAGPLGVSGAPA